MMAQIQPGHLKNRGSGPDIYTLLQWKLYHNTLNILWDPIP